MTKQKYSGVSKSEGNLEEIEDLLWPGRVDSHGELVAERNRCVVEAYRRGQKSNGMANQRRVD
jgi:hypothetical protein